MNSHVCKRDCVRRTGSAKTQINCLGCKKLFYYGCFKIALHNNQQSFFKEGSVAQFICLPCQKNITRLLSSVEGVPPHKTPESAPSINGGRKDNAHGQQASNGTSNILKPAPPDSQSSNSNENHSSVLVELGKLNDKLGNLTIPQTDTTIDYDKIEAIINKKLEYFFSQNVEHNAEARNHQPDMSCRTHYEKFDRKLDEKVDELMRAVRPINAVRFFGKPKQHTNSLELSYSTLNQSLSATLDNHDIFNIFTNFESDSWTAFDHLKGLTTEHGTKIAAISDDVKVTNSILSDIKNSFAQNQRSSNSSALVSTIINENNIDCNTLLEQLESKTNEIIQKVTTIVDKISIERKSDNAVVAQLVEPSLVKANQLDGLSSQQQNDIKQLMDKIHTELKVLNEKTSSLTIQLMERAFLNDSDPTTTQNKNLEFENSVLALQDRHRRLISSVPSIVAADNSNESNIFPPNHSQLMQTRNGAVDIDSHPSEIQACSLRTSNETTKNTDSDEHVNTSTFGVSQNTILEGNMAAIECLNGTSERKLCKSRFQHALYLKNCRPDVTRDHIYNYLLSNDIGKDDFRISCLWRMDQDPVKLGFTYVSFKINVTEGTMQRLIDENFWPSGCKISVFEQKNTGKRATNRGPSFASAVNFLQPRRLTNNT